MRKKLYFALEYCPGGELFNLLQKKRQFSEEHARFYVAQIILALEHLHKLDIIYRDLKPENVLIDEVGYIRLTDFGLSKRGIQGNKGANSVCGTPEYLAPEILFRTGHGKAVDWWTLGAILFEMLTGLPPFYTPNREELFEKIKFYALKYPNTLSPNARNLLEGLFKKDPEKRIGGGSGDATEIKEHPWFKDMDWDALIKKEIPAPFIPVIKGETDVSNFDPVLNFFCFSEF
jgi:serine/threonine protein kinase